MPHVSEMALTSIRKSSWFPHVGAAKVQSQTARCLRNSSRPNEIVERIPSDATLVLERPTCKSELTSERVPLVVVAFLQSLELSSLGLRRLLETLIVNRHLLKEGIMVSSQSNNLLRIGGVQANVDGAELAQPPLQLVSDSRSCLKRLISEAMVPFSTCNRAQQHVELPPWPGQSGCAGPGAPCRIRAVEDARGARGLDWGRDLAWTPERHTELQSAQ